MRSLWKDDSRKGRFASQSRDIKTNVLIIGGGIAGILSAYMLDKAGVDYILVEAKTICSGTTGNTTAKITLQHGLVYDKLIRKYGVERAGLYLDANKEALVKYEELCKDIDCDYKICPAAVYSRTSRLKIEREVRAYERLNYRAHFIDDTELPISVAGAVVCEKQAQFHPLIFLNSVAEGLRIYENTKVQEIFPYGVITDKGKIKADKIIVATHFPILNKHGLYPLKLYQHRSYVTALQNADTYDRMYVDDDKKGLSFREHNGLLILGGGSHRTGKKGGCYSELERFSQTYYPDSKSVAKWATQDCMTLDGLPYIGRYSKDTEGLFVATGFNKWGMTLSMVSAIMLCDMVMGKRSPYEDLFSPSRSVIHPQLVCNCFESTIGILTPTAPRCPHLGCALKYNREEHSWDCSCHGSRFDSNGELIDNPATDDIEI